MKIGQHYVALDVPNRPPFFMIRPRLLLLLFIPLTPEFAQSRRSPRNQKTLLAQYPIADQFGHLSINDGLPINSGNQ